MKKNFTGWSSDCTSEIVGDLQETDQNGVIRIEAEVESSYILT